MQYLQLRLVTPSRPKTAGESLAFTPLTTFADCREAVLAVRERPAKVGREGASAVPRPRAVFGLSAMP